MKSLIVFFSKRGRKANSLIFWIGLICIETPFIKKYPFMWIWGFFLKKSMPFLGAICGALLLLLVVASLLHFCYIGLCYIFVLHCVRCPSPVVFFKAEDKELVGRFTWNPPFTKKNDTSMYPTPAIHHFRPTSHTHRLSFLQILSKYHTQNLNKGLPICVVYLKYVFLADVFFFGGWGAKKDSCFCRSRECVTVNMWNARFCSPFKRGMGFIKYPVLSGVGSSLVRCIFIAKVWWSRFGFQSG